MTGAFLTALFFASNAVCARRAALHYGGTTGNFLRLLLAVALLAAWALERSRPTPRLWIGAVLAVLGAARLAVAE